MDLECFSALPEGNENVSHSKRFSAGQIFVLHFTNSELLM